MENTMIWEIVLTLFFLALIVLVVMLVPVVMQLRQSLTKFNQAMDTLNKDLPEVMSNVNDISKSLTVTSTKIENAADNFAEIERLITEQIKVPLRTIAQIIASLLKLVTTLAGRRKR